MSNTPELDQVTEARRKLAAHATLPGAYWAVTAIACVLLAGLPIWTSFLPGADRYFQWVLVALAAASAGYMMIRRRRTGVYLPRRAGSYPGARMVRAATLVATFAGFCGIYVLVERGHIGIALAVLVPVAVVAVLGQMRTRAAMRRDIEAGRVTP